MFSYYNSKRIIFAAATIYIFELVVKRAFLYFGDKIDQRRTYASYHRRFPIVCLYMVTHFSEEYFPTCWCLLSNGFASKSHCLEKSTVSVKLNEHIKIIIYFEFRRTALLISKTIWKINKFNSKLFGIFIFEQLISKAWKGSYIGVINECYFRINWNLCLAKYWNSLFMWPHTLD